MRATLTPFFETNFSPFDLFEEIDKTFSQQRTESKTHHFIEKNDAYLLTIDLPGVEKEDISIEAKENILELKATRYLKHLDPDSKKEYDRSFRLPRDADHSKIQAHFENGVLYIGLNKQEELKPKKVEIASGKKTGNFFSLLGFNKNEEKVEIK